RRASGGVVGATRVAMGRRTAGLRGVLWERRESRSGGEPPRFGGRCGSDASRDRAAKRRASGGVVGGARGAMRRWGGEGRGRGGKAVIATCVAPTSCFGRCGVAETRSLRLPRARLRARR